MFLRLNAELQKLIECSVGKFDEKFIFAILHGYGDYQSVNKKKKKRC